MVVMPASITPGPCYLCKKPGHIVRNCPEVRRMAQTSDRCSTCKKGHRFPWQCRTRPDMSRNQSPKKLQEERALPSRDERNNGSTDPQGRICYYSGSETLHYITSRTPSNASGLLPPGFWCTLATTKPTTFLKDSGYNYIPTGITGTSQQRQDFLVIGKERNGILGLLVLPCMISVNCNEELRVLANACHPPLHIPLNTPIAIAIALFMGTADHMPPCGSSLAHENPEVLWVQHINTQ